MKQDAIRADINYLSGRLTISYELLDLDTTGYLTTKQTTSRITSYSSKQLPGVLVVCTLLRDGSGTDSVGAMNVDISKLGFKPGSIIDHVEIQFQVAGGPGSGGGAVILRTGFPY
jgi:hypothetical protein